MSFRANAVSRGIFPSCKFYLVVVLHPTWWIPPLRLRYGRNDRRFWFGCWGYECTTVPALRAGWRQIAAATVGIPYIERYHSSEQVVFDTWRSASCRPYDKIVMNYLISDVSGIVLCPENVKNVER